MHKLGRVQTHMLFVHDLTRCAIIEELDYYIDAYPSVTLHVIEPIEPLQWAFLAHIPEVGIDIVYIRLLDDMERGKTYTFFKNRKKWLMFYPPSLR